jgi:hypothetical protein
MIIAILFYFFIFICVQKNFIVQKNDSKNNVVNSNQNLNKFGQISSEISPKVNMATNQHKNELQSVQTKQKSLKVKKFNARPTFGERISEYFNCINQESSKKSKTVTLPVVEFDTEGDMPMINKEFTSKTYYQSNLQNNSRGKGLVVHVTL